MRGRIFDQLYQRMAEDERLFLVVGDMGINLVERFQETYPRRFLNVGIAEQNLVGVGAGLANAGYRPVLYTISNFMVHRCLEQIRNDIAIHQHPVIMLGTSTGYDNAPLGPTHHILDDWGAIGTIPGIDIHCTSSLDYADHILDRLLESGRPAYVRIPKGSPEILNGNQDIVALHQPQEQRAAVITYGSLTSLGCDLAAQYPGVGVYLVQKLHPLSDAEWIPLLSRYETIAIAEDHFAHCGLYARLCELCVRNQITTKLTSFAPTGYDLTVGRSPTYFHQRLGFDVEALSEWIAHQPQPATA